jgi:hypothetical protein
MNIINAILSWLIVLLSKQISICQIRKLKIYGLEAPLIWFFVITFN